MIDVGGEKQHGGDLFHGLQLHSVDIDLAERREKKKEGVKEQFSAEREGKKEEEEVLEDVYGDLKYAEGAEVLQRFINRLFWNRVKRSTADLHPSQQKKAFQNRAPKMVLSNSNSRRKIAPR